MQKIMNLFFNTNSLQWFFHPMPSCCLSHFS